MSAPTRSMSRQYFQSLEPQPFINVLTVDGTPTGDFLANGDYSSTAQDFSFTCPPDVYVEVDELRIIVSDGGTPSRTEYGSLSAGLAVGVRAFYQQFGEPEEDVTPALRPIQANQDFERIATGLDLIKYSGTDSRAYSVPLNGAIKLNPSDLFAIRLNDDFTGLVDHQFVIIGSSRGL